MFYWKMNFQSVVLQCSWVMVVFHPATKPNIELSVNFVLLYLSRSNFENPSNLKRLTQNTETLEIIASCWRETIAPGLTTCVDDTEVLPGASVTWISKFFGGGSDHAAFLSLAQSCEDLQALSWLAFWQKQRIFVTTKATCWRKRCMLPWLFGRTGQLKCQESL